MMCMKVKYDTSFMIIPTDHVHRLLYIMLAFLEHFSEAKALSIARAFQWHFPGKRTRLVTLSTDKQHSLPPDVSVPKNNSCTPCMPLYYHMWSLCNEVMYICCFSYLHNLYSSLKWTQFCTPSKTVLKSVPVGVPWGQGLGQYMQIGVLGSSNDFYAGQFAPLRSLPVKIYPMPG